MKIRTIIIAAALGIIVPIVVMIVRSMLPTSVFMPPSGEQIMWIHLAVWPTSILLVTLDHATAGVRHIYLFISILLNGMVYVAIAGLVQILVELASPGDCGRMDSASQDSHAQCDDRRRA